MKNIKFCNVNTIEKNKKHKQLVFQNYNSNYLFYRFYLTRNYTFKHFKFFRIIKKKKMFKKYFYTYIIKKYQKIFNFYINNFYLVSKIMFFFFNIFFSWKHNFKLKFLFNSLNYLNCNLLVRYSTEEETEIFFNSLSTPQKVYFFKNNIIFYFFIKNKLNIHFLKQKLFKQAYSIIILLLLC